ncbi:MAG TPA: hypothetical protein VFW87_16665 [Pirellulales bacterium]|nr:hypothetical protein [Pirellulales bacterium]
MPRIVGDPAASGRSRSSHKNIPTDGPVWVVPKEGVMFFCSPGYGGQVETSRKLWMLRY